IKVPELPESITEATLVEWHKQPGDAVERDENLVDIETDKVVLEVPAPADGVLKEHKVEDGATVGAQDVIGLLDEGATAAAPKAAEDKGDDKADEDAGKQDADEPAGTAAAEPAQPTGEAKPLSPSVRRLIEEHDLDPAAIPASGKDGRLTKSDVLSFLEGGGKGKAQSAPAPEGKKAAPAPSAPVGAREERRVPMSRMRARIAERMIESQTSTAMLTS